MRESMQRPPAQVGVEAVPPDAQTLPQAPQLRASVLVSTQVEPQRDDVGAVHPDTQP